MPDIVEKWSTLNVPLKALVTHPIDRSKDILSYCTWFVCLDGRVGGGDSIGGGGGGVRASHRPLHLDWAS